MAATRMTAPSKPCSSPVALVLVHGTTVSETPFGDRLLITFLVAYLLRQQLQGNAQEMRSAHHRDLILLLRYKRNVLFFAGLVPCLV
jgi:hypothetical protein